MAHQPLLEACEAVEYWIAAAHRLGTALLRVQIRPKGICLITSDLGRL